MKIMDRRQKKTRNAIFNAFTDLLAKKDFNKITVGEIIKVADIGRATFYDHFETKDFLLKELSEELFCHVFDFTQGNVLGHNHIFYCNEKAPLFLHLLWHIQNNDNRLKELLTSPNNALFLNYYKSGLISLINNSFANFARHKPNELPKEFWVNHIAATFMETVKWWLNQSQDQTAETVYNYFLSAVNIPNI